MVPAVVSVVAPPLPLAMLTAMPLRLRMAQQAEG